MKFSAEFSVRFGEIDQARVVYYPRFFHYFHQTFEEWFARALGVSYFPACASKASF
jgi:4-hydroxybenzoyl-CoA thioesterase